MAARKRPAPAPAPPACDGCQGSGWVEETHRVGRGKTARPVGRTAALCPTCLGTGTNPDE
ncbi:hypothetical protein LO771_07860 [Streptacidiphilus sp. ASG 303]|nr:hypothetical protein [Streptacidiphilus sp. ASG 303]